MLDAGLSSFWHLVKPVRLGSSPRVPASAAPACQATCSRDPATSSCVRSLSVPHKQWTHCSLGFLLHCMLTLHYPGFTFILSLCFHLVADHRGGSATSSWPAETWMRNPGHSWLLAPHLSCQVRWQGPCVCSPFRSPSATWALSPDHQALRPSPAPILFLPRPMAFLWCSFSLPSDYQQF